MAEGKGPINDFLPRLGMVVTNLDAMRNGGRPVYDMAQMMAYSQSLKSRKDQEKRHQMALDYIEKTGNGELAQMYEMDPEGTTSMIFDMKKGDYASAQEASKKKKEQEEYDARITKAYEDGELSPVEILQISGPEKGMQLIMDAKNKKDEAAQKLAADKAKKDEISGYMKDGTLSPEEIIQINPEKGVQAVIDTQKTAQEQAAKAAETQRLNEALFGPIDSGEPVFGAGNINLNDRPIVPNEDGTISTVESKSFNIGGKEVLLPTITDTGDRMTDAQAIEQYKTTGRHLGIFSNAKEADTYAKRLSDDQEKRYKPRQDPRSALNLPAAPYTTDDEVARAQRLFAIDPKVGESYADDLRKLAEIRIGQEKDTANLDLNRDELALKQDQFQFEQDKFAVDQLEKDEPTLESGRMWVDPSDKSKGTVAIPGSTAAREDEAAARKIEGEQATTDAENEKAFEADVSVRNKATQIIESGDRVLKAIEESGTLYSPLPVAGPGKWLSGIPMTAAKNVANDLFTMKAGLGFEELNKMRRESPTGGALGNVTEIELYLLQSTQETLDQAEDPETLAMRIKSVQRAYKDIINGTTQKRIDALRTSLGTEDEDRTREAFDKAYGFGAADSLLGKIKASKR